jgi:hypothetical protein
MDNQGSYPDTGTASSDAPDSPASSGTRTDQILQEHLEKALDSATDQRARYHLRAGLQRFELE